MKYHHTIINFITYHNNPSYNHHKAIVTTPTELPRKSHHVAVPYNTMHQCAHVSTFLLQNGVLWDVFLLYYGICEMDLLSLSIDTYPGAEELLKRVFGGL